MNIGYKMLSESYRKHGDVKSANIYDFLSRCDYSDFCEIFDSGAFNDIARAYLKKALQGAELPQETIDNVLNEFRYLLSEKSASEVL